MIVNFSSRPNPARLSDRDLLERVKQLAQKERALLVELLHHLKEVDSRRLYLDAGHSSLWAYCTRELNYSEAAAHRRIQAMRALREMPAIESKIENGSLSLSNVAKAQSALQRKCRAEKVTAELATENEAPISSLALFQLLENKSQKEADQILAQHLPESVSTNEKMRALNAESSELRIIISSAQLEKLQHVKSLLSHKNPNPTWAELIELMADFIVARKDPSRQQKSLPAPPLRRRTEIHLAMTEDNPAMTENKNFSRVEKEGSRLATQRPTRYIPAEVRRQVWLDADGSCQYISPLTGRRCLSRHQLEIDHIVPMAFGGRHERKNLRLYCRQHNRLTAREATLLA